MSSTDSKKTGRKNRQLDLLLFLHQVQESLSKIWNVEKFCRRYRSWVQKIVPYESIALLLYDNREKEHIILDVYPEGFRQVIQHQLEEGIIQWAGKNDRMFESEHISAKNDFENSRAFFIPLKHNGCYSGLLELVPRKKNCIMDKSNDLALKHLSSIFADHFELLNLRKNVNEANLAVTEISNEFNDLRQLALLGELSFGVFHELSNPMTTINGRIGLSLRSKMNSGKVRSNLELVEKESCRISEVLHDFSAITRCDQMNSGFSSIININEIVKKAIRLTGLSTKLNNIKIVSKLDPAESKINGNQNLLMEVFCHLILHGTKTKIDQDILLIRSCQKDNTVIIEFIVIGCSESPGFFLQNSDGDVKNKVFTNFAGLVYSFCENVISDHQGKISVENCEENRNAITIILPLAAKLNNTPVKEKKSEAIFC